MFNWLSPKSTVDGYTQMVIDEDNRRMTARRNYVEHEKAMASGQSHTISYINMFPR
jgi:hypothetical protein